MSSDFRAAMLEATRLTKAGRLDEATALIRRTLASAPAGAAMSSAAPPGRRPAPAGIDRPLDAAAAALPLLEAPSRTRSEPAQARGFLAGSFALGRSSREYRLYVPPVARPRGLPLVVMLHGCTQDPEDFAAGTRMNALADEREFVVLYPAQSRSANKSGCWNWFRSADQRRGGGEAELLARMTRHVVESYALDAQRVYVAGLSAGAAMATVLGATHPDVFRAIGVHSGLPYGAARNLPSALAAMRGKTAASPPLPDPVAPPPRVIVFHGDGDTTVHPSNAAGVAAQALARHEGALDVHRERGEAPGGRAYTRTLHVDRDGRALVEDWLIHGGGHAWSGGSPAGSFTDPQGPDASAEFLRFFLDAAASRRAG